MNNDKQWLNELKAGDDVLIRGSRELSAQRIAKVDRTTATQVIVGNARYRRKDGFQMGLENSWYSVWLAPVTQEVRDALRCESMAKYINRADLSHLRLDQLTAIMKIIRGAG